MQWGRIKGAKGLGRPGESLEEEGLAEERAEAEKGGTKGNDTEVKLEREKVKLEREKEEEEGS